MTDLLHRYVKSDYILSVSHHSLINLRKEQSCIQFQVPTALLMFSTCLSVCIFTHPRDCVNTHIFTQALGCLLGVQGLWHKAHSEAIH